MMAKKKHSYTIPGLFLILIMLAYGCEQTFDPIQENDQYPFSIHGYLDASAESNWVRVTEVRDTLFMGDPESTIDAVVTLEDLESGEMVIMRDSLHRFSGDNYAFNFWTDMDIEPEKTYRLTVERSDGTTSNATVTTPQEIPYVSIRLSESLNPTDTLSIPAVQHLADVVVTYDIVVQYPSGDLPIEHNFRHVADTLQSSHPDTQVLIGVGNHLSHMRRAYFPYSFVIRHREVKVSSAGPGWRYFSSLDDNLVSLPEGTSNIENGTGYIIGVVSKTIHYEGY